MPDELISIEQIRKRAAQGLESYLAAMYSLHVLLHIYDQLQAQTARLDQLDDRLIELGEHLEKLERGRA